MSLGTAERCVIVLARVGMTGSRFTGRQVMVDGNWRAEIERAPEAKAAVWVNDGGAKELAKARAFAAQEGYTVLTFPLNEPDPIEAAKAAVMKEFTEPAEPARL